MLIIVRWQIKNNDRKIDEQIKSSTKSINDLIKSNTKTRQFILLSEYAVEIMVNLMNTRLIGVFDKDKIQLSDIDHIEIKEAAASIITALKVICVMIEDEKQKTRLN